MSLKTLCSKLARKPILLDIMLLFDKPINILQPICNLLDNWHYDEDQGEYQPVYEEFGSILLLVLSFAHRYGLSPVDMGIRSPLSFTTKLLNQGHLSRAMENLSEQEQNHLDGWIRGLFDNESGGLGDELMSSCPPQDFYLLVPTLFHHIVLACSTNNLSEEGLKNGLEYLIDTFLLPSLIPGLTWLSSHLWESRGDANAVLTILTALLPPGGTTPSTSNPEATSMLHSILHIIAKPLEHSLRWLQRAEPIRQDVEPLSKSLRPHLAQGFERRAAADHTELELWSSTPLSQTLRNTVAAFTQWSLNPGININPTPYTHRLLLACLKILGAKRTLLTLLDEVRVHTELGNGSAVLDVVAALVCAPEAAAWDGNLVGADELLAQGPIQPLQRRLTLREVLKSEVADVVAARKTKNPIGVNINLTNGGGDGNQDDTATEATIRLYRRVEALLAVQVQVQQPVLMTHGLVGGEMSGMEMEGMGEMGGMEGMGNMTGMGEMGEMDMDMGVGGQGLDDDLMSGFVGSGDLLDGFGDGGLGDALF